MDLSPVVAVAVSVLAVAAPPVFGPTQGMVERLGVAAILVLAAAWMVRYFIAQLDKKDQRLTDLTDRFLAATKEHTVVVEGVRHELQLVRETNHTLITAINNLRPAVEALERRS